MEMAECMYYDSQDIMELLKVGKHKANEIMHMFEQRGQLFRHGKTMRIRKAYFDEWLSQMDGPEKRSAVLNAEFQRARRRKA